MSVSSVRQRRAFLRALFRRKTASRAERTARRHFQRARHISLENDSLGALCNRGIRDRHCRQQRTGVGMNGAFIEFIRIRRFHHSSQIHNGNSVRNMPYDQQVVSPSFSCSSSNMLMTCAWMETSSAETASSQTMNLGSTASALAIPIRCLWPPENSWT